MTKTQLDKMASWYTQWLNSNYYELYEVYGSYSAQKGRSFRQIKDDMCENNGRDLRIMGHNSNTYTCAYICGPYEEPIFRVETAYNTYTVDIKELLAHINKES